MRILAKYKVLPSLALKRVFGLVIDFGTSQSPKSTRPLTTYLCPSRPGHQALRNNFASSLLLRTWLPMTGRRVRRPTLFSLWRKARRENSAASRLLGSTSLRFALHGWQRWFFPGSSRPACQNSLKPKRVFGLVIDFGTSQSPKSTRPLTTYWCPSRPGHQALRNNFASSLLLRTWLPYDWTPRSEAYFVFPLAQGTPGKQCGLAATGVYQPSLRSPWLAAIE